MSSYADGTPSVAAQARWLVAAARPGIAALTARARGTGAPVGTVADLRAAGGRGDGRATDALLVACVVGVTGATAHGDIAVTVADGTATATVVLHATVVAAVPAAAAVGAALLLRPAAVADALGPRRPAVLIVDSPGRLLAVAPPPPREAGGAGGGHRPSPAVADGVAPADAAADGGGRLPNGLPAPAPLGRGATAAVAPPAAALPAGVAPAAAARPLGPPPAAPVT